MTSKKILLVDDVRVFLEIGKTFLKRSGCQVLTAKSGMEALEKIHSEVPDLVFLDLMMPDMDGDKVCESVTKDEKLKKIPIIMVSASEEKEDIEKCRRAGCEDYLIKPVKQEDLVNKAAQILEVSQREDLRITVRMKVEGEAGAESFYGESEDISIGGMLIKSKVLMKEGSLVKLKFFLPGQLHHIEVKGEIIRIDEESFKPEYGLGVIFQDMDSNAKETIEGFIKKER